MKTLHLYILHYRSPLLDLGEHIWTHPGGKSCEMFTPWIETRAYIPPLKTEKRDAPPRSQMESALLILIKSGVFLWPRSPQVLKKLVSASWAIFSCSGISTEFGVATLPVGNLLRVHSAPTEFEQSVRQSYTGFRRAQPSLFVSNPEAAPIRLAAAR